MSIEDVIARSRQPGAFVERKRFAVERANAIRKMRQFALADPHYYVLELVQSAVANSASSIDLVAREDMCLFSYVGGGYSEDELLKLFDFLFAAKSDMAYSALRQLALGVNALMLMNPTEIIIESGDGSVEGTTRVEIRPGEDVVDVGTPERALDGTFVRASGLKRKLIHDKSNLSSTDYGPPETRAIEERCLTLPIPIIVNDRSVFGFSSVRSPTLFGYSKVIAIDEGDLYGSLGLTSDMTAASFKLLTYGTWVQTVDHALLAEGQFGGIISFDRLNKTADHAAIVQDLRYEELWARLQPYARRLVYGAGEAAKYEVQTFAGKPLSAREVVELLGAHDFAVIVPDDVTVGSSRGDRAQRIARGLAKHVPVLRVQPEDVHRIKHLSSRARVLMPDLDTDRDELFLQKPLILPPAAPWLIQPFVAAPVTLGELIGDLWAVLSPYQPLTRAIATELTTKLNGRWVELRKDAKGNPDLSVLYNVVEGVEDGSRHVINEHAAVIGLVRSTIYAPTHAFAAEDETLVRVVSSERLLWAGRVPSMFPGLVVVIELDGVMPRHMDVLSSELHSVPFAQRIAESMLRFLQADLDAATQRVFDNLRQEDIAPHTTAAQVCLGVLARDGHMRMISSTESSSPRFELVMMRPSSLDLVHAPLLESLAGEPRSFAELFAHMPTQGGLIYGVVDREHAALDGLDPGRLLSLTLAQEALLTSIVGAAAYVRVDARDTLAMISSPTRVQVRDMVLGDAWSDARMRAGGRHDLWVDQNVELDATSEQALLVQLVELMRAEPSEDLNDEDLRRQALRHVQRFVIRRHFTGGETFGFERLPLLVDLYGRVCSVEELAQDCARRGGHVLMGDGRAMDLLLRPHAAIDAPRFGLAMNPYLAVLLSEFLRVNAAFDFSLKLEIDAGDVSRMNLSSAHFLFGHDVSDEVSGISGRIGIPLEAPHASTSSLLLRERSSGRCLALPSLTQELGIVGMLHMDDLDGLDSRVCEALLYRHASSMFERLVNELPARDVEPLRWSRAVEVLLANAEQHLQLVKTSQGVRCQVYHVLSQRILMLPLFDTVGRQPVSAMSLIKSYCMKVDGYTQATNLLEQLDPSLDGVLRQWLDRNLSLDRVERQQRDEVSITPSPVGATHAGPGDVYVHASGVLERWLTACRPDEYKPIHVITVDRHIEAHLSRVEMYMGPALAWFGTSAKKRDTNPILFVDWGGEGVVCVDVSHALFAPLLSGSTSSPTQLAWALLAIYAHLNAMLEPITNPHERQFHVRIMQALDRGEFVSAS